MIYETAVLNYCYSWDCSTVEHRQELVGTAKYGKQMEVGIQSSMMQNESHARAVVRDMEYGVDFGRLSPPENYQSQDLAKENAIQHSIASLLGNREEN